MSGKETTTMDVIVHKAAGQPVEVVDGVDGDGEPTERLNGDGASTPPGPGRSENKPSGQEPDGRQPIYPQSLGLSGSSSDSSPYRNHFRVVGTLEQDRRGCLEQPTSTE